MEIKPLAIDDGIACLKLVGSLDWSGAAAVRPEFARLTAGNKPVLLEMSELTFIASCGMQLALAAMKNLNAGGLRMAALNPRPLVKTAWEAAGMMLIIPVFTDEDAAVAYLKQQSADHPGGEQSARRPEKVFARGIGNDLSELAEFCHQAHNFMEAEKLDAAPIYKIDLALEEMLTNVIKYGYDDNKRHEIKVELRLTDEQIRLEMRDDGHEFNPLEAVPSDLSADIEQRRVGGMGIHLARAMADSISYSRSGNANVVVVLVKLK